MDDMTDDTATALPTHQVSAADRLQRFREDDEALAELAEIVHKRAMAQGESANPSGHLDLKIRERRAAMWGYDSPVRFDMVQVQEHKRPSSYEMIKAAIYSLRDQASPAERAVREKLEQLGPEKALAMLNSGTSECTSDSPGSEKE
jgi:hypothetical protein